MSFKIYTAQEFEPLYQSGKIDFNESFIINPQTIGVFQNHTHRENHLNYLFNKSSKYFNDRTKYNVYFEFEKQLWLRETDREELCKKYKAIYKNYEPSRCAFQRFEFNVGADRKFNFDTLQEVVNELEKLDFFVNGPRSDIKDLIYIFHGNQDNFFTHFHRLFHLPNE